MRRYTGGLFYLIGGALAGTLSAYAMVEHTGIQMLGTNSPWQSRIAALEGATGIYVASSYLLAGRLPLAPGQLVEASAEADNDGEMLTASCTYEITSTGPLPRWWSVAVLNPGGSATSDQAALDRMKQRFPVIVAHACQTRFFMRRRRSCRRR